MNRFSIVRILVVGFAMLFLAAGVSYAQTASVSGTTTDATGAVVPDVNVTARNAQTNSTRSTQTGDTGFYRITALVPAIYEIVFEKSGFRTLRYSNVVLTVDQSLTLDVKIEVSAVTESVEVSGQNVAPIELENAQISNVVDARRISDLPLVVRDPYQLVLLSPGTVQTNSGLGGFAINGSRERNNNFLLDGVDNNDTDVPGIPGGVSSLNPDSTQEFRVITNNFLPEFGRNTGAIIDVVTKSGTNSLHGGAYWFGRYSALGARDFFNNIPGSSKDPYVRNDFGGQVGGPIIKDKTFWFVNYEGQRFLTTRANSAIVPTAAFKAGFFNIVSGGNVLPVDVRTPSSPSNRFHLPLDPTIQRVLAAYPLPNTSDVIDAPGDTRRGRFRFSSLDDFKTDNFTVKVDHHINQNNVLSVRYVFNQPTDLFGPSDNLPGIGGFNFIGRAQNAAITLTSTIRPTLINELRVGGNRLNAGFPCRGFDKIDSLGSKDAVGRGRDFILPGFTQFACEPLGDSNGQIRFTGTYSVYDALTSIRGRHTYKVGIEHRRVYSNSFTDFFSRSTPNFAGFSQCGFRSTNDLDPATPGTQTGGSLVQDMVYGLFGTVCFETQSQYFNKGGTRTQDDLRGFRQREWRLYAQDVWKVASNLTFNYGVVWQFFGVPFEVNNNFSMLFADASGSAPFTFQIIGPGTGRELYRRDGKGFEPRVGIAWDPFKKGKTSVRAGYGIFHDRTFGNLFVNARGNPPFQQDFFDSSFFPPAGSFPNVTNTPLPATQVSSPVVADEAGIFPVLFDRNFRVPYTQQWNFGVQHELFSNLTVEVNYVGTKGNRLFRVVDGNPPQPGLVAALVAFCSVPNAFGCTPATLQFTSLWFGADFFGNIPFNAVNNNAFFQAALNTSRARSTYHALQANITKRFSHGFQIQGAYTWSHSIDNASDPLVAGSGNRSFPRNSFHLERERGNSDFDNRQRVVINYIYEIPVGRGRAHWHDGVIGRVFEGWQVAGISTFASGLPYDIFTNRDSQHTGLSDRATIIGDPKQPAGVDRTFTGPRLAAFGFTPFNQPSNLGRNRFTTPGINNWDMVASKTTSLSERFKADLRFEFYNLFNRVQFDRPGNSIASPGTFGISTAQVGRPDGTAGSRQIQLAFKLHF